MRTKRMVAWLTSAVMVCALCLTLLPGTALAAGYARLAGVTLNEATPYYKDGRQYSSEPAWTAWFDGGVLHLRNLVAPANVSDSVDSSISWSDSSLTIALQNNSVNSYMITTFGVSSSAVTGNTLTVTGNGSLSVTGGRDGGYGIEASVSITLKGGATLVAAGDSGATNKPVSLDWSKYTVTASTDKAGSPQTIDEATYNTSWTTYKYVCFAANAPAPAPTASIDDATVSGTMRTTITPVDATLTLTNAQFKALAADADVSGWFTNMPTGLSAKIKTAITTGATSATVTFSGIPLATSTAAMTVTISAANLVENAAVPVTANANAKWAIAPPIPVAVTPAASFPQGQAPNNLTLSIGSTGSQPNSATHFDRLEISGNGAGFTVVDPANYSLTYGSIHIAMAQNYLNTLAPGTYTLHIYLAGAFSGLPLTTYLTVTAPGGAEIYGDVGPDVPKTGDNTPLALFGALMLLCGAGLAMRRTRRKKEI